MTGSSGPDALAGTASGTPVAAAPAATAAADDVTAPLPMVPCTPEQVAEARQLNLLIEQFMSEVPSFATIEGIRALRTSGFGMPPAEVPVEEGTAPGPVGPIPVRTFVPDAEPAAVVLSIHGGGWCIGDAANGDLTNRQLADDAGVVVVALDYRLAPEHPWPAAPDDCEATARWLLDEMGSRWGCGRLVLSGDSAGAHLAAVTALRLRRAGLAHHLAGANLVFGAFDLGMTPSQRAAEGALVIPTETLNSCYRHLLPGLDREDRRHPRYSPLYADLTGLCPALLTVGTLDPLLDDSLFMAARWQAAGNEARLDVYPECPHGFPGFDIELGRVALARMRDWISDVARRPTAAG